MPSKVRYQIIGSTTLAAVILYLDRICMGEIAKLDEFKSSLQLSKEQVGLVLGASFFAYALAQVPAGWLSDRFGARKMMPFYICFWSLCTMLTGLATGFVMLIAVRLLFGIAQAGCYPTAGSLIKRWIPLHRRGTASGVISLGGRAGGALAPVLTALLLKDYLSWQWVLVLYGLSGFLIAALFWKVFRETPELHPRTNEAERKLIVAGDLEAATTGPVALPPLLPLVRSGSMWLMCAIQFGINIGWVFVVTWLPTYLTTVKRVEEKTSGLMSTIVLLCGIVGMICGGPLADFAIRVLGRRWGRSLPLVACSSVAIGAYLSCLSLESAWSIVAAFSVMAFMTDMGVPAIWAYMQDVGGKNTAAVFGWGNMWGNFGAALMPVLVPLVVDPSDPNDNWHAAFVLFSAGYLIAALAALGINANRTIG